MTGSDIPYGGGATGYALDPADTINYVSKHDNQTLWDNNQYRIPYTLPIDERVRMQNLALAYPLLSQGIPFIHMGSELLRSKSFLRDSYDYGDWFNAVDFSKRVNNYDVGLPPAVKDEVNWPVIRELLDKNQGRDRVAPQHIDFAATIFMEWLQIRSSSPLFRLDSEGAIIERVSFHNTGVDQQEGIIAMLLDDEGFERDLDSEHLAVMVIFNSSPVRRSVPYSRSAGYRLHPVQASGADRRIRDTARVTAEGFEVPGLSAVVFVK